MLIHPIVAALFGGWEILLILAAIFVLAMSAIAVLGLILLVVRNSQKQTHTLPPPMPPPTRPGG